jgi:SAM-dependent methyltransferase
MRDRPATDLFLVSWVVLFLELACIRWFPSHVMFLTFFTNTVLLAAFVGMSVGCLVARRPGRLLNTTPYLLAAAVAAGLLCDQFSDHLNLYLAVGNQANPEVVMFGTETAARDEPPFTVPIEVVGGLFFVLVAAVMAGPGQELGRAFNRVPGRTAAYSANLLGSLVGIGMFAACSYLRLPPPVWFGLVAVTLAYLLLRRDPDAPAPAAPRPSPAVPLVCLGLTVVMTVFTAGFFPGKGGRETTWSPYYRIDYYPRALFINTNLISQQLMEPLDSPSVATYALPYLFQRDLTGPGGRAWPEFKRVLIIGAGSGNDVARACRWLPKDAQIDAVEIDPVIQKLGERHHPDRPFQDPRVKVFLNDGRNFLRDAPAETYDLVVFALIDSLVLQSGYSNLRLESYLFTLESFRDVRRVLKPTGVYAVYNFLRQGWIACRIRDQLRTAFGGVDPVALTVPAQDAIPLDDPLYKTAGFVNFFAGTEAVVGPVRRAFADPGTRYWYPWKVGIRPDSPARFAPAAPDEPPPAAGASPSVQPEWLGLRLAAVEEPGGMRQATDDWPFLYTRAAAVPALTWRGVALTLVLSALLWYLFGGHRALGAEAGTAPEWGNMARSFFLGAGFMLVETKAIVEMALLFGGTWMVNTVVIAAILVMSLVGNLYAGWVKPARLEPYYVGLFVALGVVLAVPVSTFLGLSPALQVVGVCALVFTPVAFAGVIFATTFRRTAQPDRVFGANIAGALIGGLSENASVLLGFQYLLCVAVGFYLLSAVSGNRRVPGGAAAERV